MNDDISKAIATFRAFPNLDDYAMYRALVAAGVDHRRAAHLVEFLPLVYSRLIFRNSGALFSHTFRRSLPEGRFQEQPLASEPLWNEAVTFANAEGERGVSGQDLLAIGARSAEFDAAACRFPEGMVLLISYFSSPS